MHLLNITNLDYVMMTILLGVIAVISYSFRRKNLSSGDYLVMQNHRVNVLMVCLSMSGFGLIEFLLLSSYGAYAGIPALCFFIPCFLVASYFLGNKLTRSSSFNSITSSVATNIHQRVILICYALFMLISASIAICAMVWILKNLLGWEFGNSTLSLLGVVLICLLIGGVVSVFYNQVLALILSSLIVAVVVIIAYHGIGSGNLIANLHRVATENKLSANHFTTLQLNYSMLPQLWLVFVTAMLMVLINPLNRIKYVKSGKEAKSKLVFSKLIQLLILCLFVLTGIFALATPGGSSSLSDGKRLVTQQTRLEDGSIGFVVRAVDSDTPSLARGIIPKQMSNSNDMEPIDSAQNSFDYISAAMVMVKHSLPAAFVSLFLVILLFYKSVTESLAFVNIVTIQSFYVPLFNKTGEDLESLWAARVFLFAYTAVAICIGLVFYKFFDLYYLFAVLLVLGLPLILNLFGLGKHFIVNIVAYILIIGSLLILNISNVPSLLPLIKFKDIFSYLNLATLIITGYYVLSHLIIKLIGRDSL